MTSRILLAIVMLPAVLGLLTPGYGGAQMSSDGDNLTRISGEQVAVQTNHFALAVSAATGDFSIKDRATGEFFDGTMGPSDGKLLSVQPAKSHGQHAIRCRFALPKGGEVSYLLVVLPSGRDIDIRVESRPSGIGESGSQLLLFHDAFSLAAKEPGYLVLPVGMGRLMDPDSAFDYKWQAHVMKNLRDELTMMMFGVVKNHSALLLSWKDVETQIETQALPASVLFPKRVALSAWGNAGVRVRVCGEGDYVTVTQNYRELAREKGLLVPFRQRIKQWPAIGRLQGSFDVKCFMKEGQAADCPHNQEKKERHSTWMNFDDAAAIAKHLHDDLGMSHGMFVLAGWVRGGYDFSHPDIWPPDDDLGGPDGLARVGKTVRDMGWLFGLHDNYDMMFKSQPSANKEDSIAEICAWAGGAQYSIHPKRQAKYAERNLKMIKECCGPDAYFVDQMTALSLYQTDRKDLPLTHAGCIDAYRDLITRVKSMTGVMGSEDGQEWAVPYLDYHEGILSPDMYPKIGKSVPLFELVYHDCFAGYWHQGFTLGFEETRTFWGGACADPKNYLELLSLGRTLSVTNLSKRFWEQHYVLGPNFVNVFALAKGGWGEGLNAMDILLKNTYEFLSPTNELAFFLPITSYKERGKGVIETVFGKRQVSVVVNHGESPVTEHEAVLVTKSGFLVEAPTFLAFNASEYRGVKYDTPALFTVRSLDGKPIERSSKLRVYHGFGPSTIVVPTKRKTAFLDGRQVQVNDGKLVLDIRREAVVELR